MKITISSALGWQKTLRDRHVELMQLRNQNSTRETRMYGANVDKERIIEPLYDVVELDNLITSVAREMRLLDEAIKTTNQNIMLVGYERDDKVLGVLVAAKK